MPRFGDSARSWRWAAAARDLHVVEIVGDNVTGASDAPTRLRERYTLPRRGFTVVLIGKDGGVKPRQSRPVAATVLEETIDAIPMRRAGQR
nr:DUF4174 domain-containing protein [Sphingomonas yunnanensis]